MAIKNIPTRSEWKAFRDRKGPGSGIAKQDVGPTLDKVHKAARKNIQTAVAPLEKLEKALKAYDKACKEKLKKEANADKKKEDEVDVGICRRHSKRSEVFHQ